jgi:hypothetical protein
VVAFDVAQDWRQPLSEHVNREDYSSFQLDRIISTSDIAMGASVMCQKSGFIGKDSMTVRRPALFF